MAIRENAKIQIRRGKESEHGIPALSSGELAWAIDTQKLFIGNGLVSEGAPTEGVTQLFPSPDVSALLARLAVLEAKVAALGG